MWAWAAAVNKKSLKSRPVGLSLIMLGGLFCVFIKDGGLAYARPKARSARAGKKIKKFSVRKKKSAVPGGKITIRKIKQQTLKAAQPPRQFRRYFEEGTDEAELESVINEEIKQLFQLLKTSRRRDLRLRLGSLYVEKAHLIEYRLYEEYDRKLKLFDEKKLSSKPRFSLRPTYAYINKAIKLFETYRRQYPKDKRMDQVLFFLGVSYFKRNQLKKGKARYDALVKRFPKSSYINDVYFELGEYYFSKSLWKQAARHYAKALKPSLSMYSFALYKLAWCAFNQGKVNRALAHLEKVVHEGARRQAQTKSGAGRPGAAHFSNEALGDAALFYSRSGRHPVKALPYFYNLSGSAKKAQQMLKALAYAYLDQGYLKGIRIAFKQLVEEDPFAPQAYDYQYQIIRAYTYAGGRKVFLRELNKWLLKYGPDSAWAGRNRRRPDLIQKAAGLMEVTVRNYTLRMHQSFRKTKGPMAKSQALFGYDIYSKTFSKSKWSDQMLFFYGELLFDVRRYRQAARQYMRLVETFKTSKYYELAALNGVLAFEKTLPSSKRIKQMVGPKKTPVAFPQHVDNFQKTAHYYIQRFPRKKNVPAILYKTASLHYEFNHYQEALAQFWMLIKQYPKSSYTEYSANLILDIYNFQKDFEGLRAAAVRLLSNKMIAQSASARAMRKILSQISLKTAESMAGQKRYLESAKLYKSFADSHPSSPVRMTAYYNAAVNFKKGGDTLKAIALDEMLLKPRSKSPAKLKKSILEDLPKLYKMVGRYRRAARAFSSFARSYPRDSKAADFWFNAALIYDGFNNYTQAETAYLQYFKKSRKADKAHALYLLAGLMKRRGQALKAVSYYNQFLNKGTGDKRALVESAFNIADIYRARKNLKQTRRWYHTTVQLYNKYKAGVFYAAQAQFNLVHYKYLDFRKIKIPAHPQKQRRAVQKKLQAFNRLKESLKKVIRFDSGQQVVSALVLIGLASQHIGEAIYYSPVPRGLNKAEKKVYRQGLLKTARPFKEEAVRNYQLAVEKARRLGAYDPQWLRTAVENLSFFGKSPIAKEAYLRKTPLPVMMVDWSGI